VAARLSGRIPLETLFEEGLIEGEIPLSDENNVFVCTINSQITLSDDKQPK
jgi:hypothetical protein